VAFEIERCNSLLRADEIKGFFQRNDRSTFPALFERAYPPAMAAGGSSWIARDAQGVVVGHLAAFPRLFRSAVGTARAALLVDLLVEERHRDFWSAVALCRRAVSDLCSAGAFDFAFTDPTPPAQLALKAAGFAQSAAFERFVTPVHALYNRLFQIAARTEPLLAERVDRGDQARVSDALRAVPPGSYFRAERSLELYATRLGGEAIADWEWLVLRPQRDPRAPDAALAVTSRQAGGATLSIVDLVWDERRVPVASVLQAIIEVAGQEGCNKLSISTLANGSFVRALRSRGFIRRADTLPLFVVRTSCAELPPVSDWFLTYFDGSGW